MTIQKLRASWKAHKQHSAIEHAQYILMWAAIIDADPEKTLVHLKKAFSPLKRSTKIANSRYGAYSTLIALCDWIRYLASKSEDDELQQRIAALAVACCNSLKLDARMQKVAA